MIAVTCQYTGVEFEAASKRSKNHPLVSEFLNAANKEGKSYIGAYHYAKEFLAVAEGNTIEEIMEFVNGAFCEWKKSDAKSFKVETYKSNRKRQERDSQRISLRNAGYTWHKEDEESMDFAGPNAFNGNMWTLLDPHGNEVSKSDAMKAIA